LSVGWVFSIVFARVFALLFPRILFPQSLLGEQVGRLGLFPDVMEGGPETRLMQVSDGFFRDLTI
jgi:hypothetical protein